MISSDRRAGDSAALCGYDELPVVGYLDRLSARPGETLEARISVRDGGTCAARLLRVISADPNPAGPGLRYRDCSDRFSVRFEGRRQPIALGSWMEACGPARDPIEDGRTWTVLAMPTLAQATPRVVLHQEDGPGRRLTLSIGADHAVAQLGDRRMMLEHALAPDRWYRLWFSISTTGEAVFGIAAPAHFHEPGHVLRHRAAWSIDDVPDGGSVRVGCAVPGDVSSNFTGKIEDPAVLRGVRDVGHDPLADLDAFADALLAGWDFSGGIGLQSVPGLGRHGVPGILHNAPLRAVVGARWRGGEHDWRRAPREYAAIKFHEDDLGDCGWETDFRFVVPDGLASGAYLLHLQTGHGEDWLPFYVLPERYTVRPRTVFVAATYTYLAYANNARANTDQAFFERVQAWGAYPYNPDQYPLYGRSTYNLHPDGSGVVHSSRLRPMLTVRPAYLTFLDEKGSGIRHFSADTHILAWLEDKGFDIDIVTDDELNEEGGAILRPYDVVLTGTHPEYHTAATLDALQAHVDRGGRLAYLGGNGFYWRIGHGEAAPWLLELRRAENGVRRWGSEPGEYHHALDGELGGLWSRARRDARQLVGVSFAAQGPYEASYFRRTAASYDPAMAWMFEGVEEDRLGDYGLIAGGSAGFEIDRADWRRGTPADAIVVAVTEGLPAGFFPAHEDLGGVPLALGGGDAADLVRGDMIWFETASGGAVFSASSITFCGSLWKDGSFAGPVSRMLENIITRMLQRSSKGDRASGQEAGTGRRTSEEVP